MTLRYKILGFVAGLLLAIGIVACGGSGADNKSGNSDTGLNEARVKELIGQALNDYENRIAALEAEVATLKKSVNVVVAQPRTATAMVASTTMAKTASNDEPQEVGIGCAPSGYLPATQFTAEYIQCTTPQGFYVNVPKEGGPPRKMEPHYETADCTGTPWLPRISVSGALRNGAVFSYEDALGEHVGYIPPTPQIRTVTVQTVYNFVEEKCESFGATIVRDDMIEVLTHTVGADGFNTMTGARNIYPPSTVTVQQ